MKKYYARQLPSDHYYGDEYFNEDEAEAMNLILLGNRNCSGMNEALYKQTLKQLEAYDEECAEREYRASTTDEPVKLTVEEYTEIAGHHFTKHNDDSKPCIFTEEDITVLNNSRELLEEAEHDAVLETLEVIFECKFTTGTLHGCCQGDYIGYICPESTNQEELDYIEAAIFGTGTEFRVCEVPLESADEFDEHLDDTGDMLTAKWRTKDIKADIARNISADCKPEDVVILSIVAEHHYTTYDYEEE